MTLLRVATINDNFGNAASNLPHVAPYADVMLTQESKYDNVRRILLAADGTWGVNQDMRNASTRGSAVCWRLAGPFRRGSDDQRVAVAGRGILPRRFTITHGRVGLAPVTLIATHRPPGRHKRLWRGFDAALAAYCTLLRLRRRFVVIGLDANERNPQALARRCGLVWVAPPGSIDGFLISKQIRPHPAKRLPKWTSDHHPVLCYLDVPNRSRP